MRDYDTTNIALIRQPRKQLVRIIVRLVEREKEQIHRLNTNQARDTTDEEFVEKAAKKKLSV